MLYLCLNVFWLVLGVNSGKCFIAFVSNVFAHSLLPMPNASILPPDYQGGRTSTIRNLYFIARIIFIAGLTTGREIIERVPVYKQMLKVASISGVPKKHLSELFVFITFSTFQYRRKPS